MLHKIWWCNTFWPIREWQFFGGDIFAEREFLAGILAPKDDMEYYIIFIKAHGNICGLSIALIKALMCFNIYIQVSLHYINKYKYIQKVILLYGQRYIYFEVIKWVCLVLLLYTWKMQWKYVRIVFGMFDNNIFYFYRKCSSHEYYFYWKCNDNRQLNSETIYIYFRYWSRRVFMLYYIHREIILNCIFRQ